MRTAPIQRHHYCRYMQVSERHPSFLKPLLTLPLKMRPEALLCYTEHNSGEEVLWAQPVSTPRTGDQPALSAVTGAEVVRRMPTYKDSDLPVVLQCLKILQLYHRVVPAQWMSYESSLWIRKRCMMKGDSLILSPRNSHSLWVASDVLLTEEPYDGTKSLRHICPKCWVTTA